MGDERDDGDDAPRKPPFKWTKGVADPGADARVNIWSLNGHGEPVFTGGQWDADESRILDRAVRDYCASKRVAVTELCGEGGDRAAHDDREVRGAWAEIAQALPHRTVLSVYRRALRQCHGMTRGKWSEEEVASLFRLVELHGQRWSVIRDKLGRSATDCRVKFFDMNDQFERGKWSTERIELLLRVVRAVLHLPRKDMDVREINQWTLEHNSKIPWTAISGKVGRRRCDCYFKWKQMTKRSNRKAVKLGLEPMPMARDTHKAHARAEYYQWKAEQDPKWREKYAEKYIMPLLREERDGSDDKKDRIQLLDSIIQSKAIRPSEVPWNTFVERGDAPREIWDDLVDEYARDDDMDLPLWKLAQTVKAAMEKKASQKEAPPPSEEDRPKKKRRRKNQRSKPHVPHSFIQQLRRTIEEILESDNDLTVTGVLEVLLLEEQFPVDLSSHKDMVKEMVEEALQKQGGHA